MTQSTSITISHSLERQSCISNVFFQLVLNYRALLHTKETWEDKGALGCFKGPDWPMLLDLVENVFTLVRSDLNVTNLVVPVESWVSQNHICRSNQESNPLVELLLSYIWAPPHAEQVLPLEERWTGCHCIIWTLITRNDEKMLLGSSLLIGINHSREPDTTSFHLDLIPSMKSFQMKVRHALSLSHTMYMI